MCDRSSVGLRKGRKIKGKAIIRKAGKIKTSHVSKKKIAKCFLGAM